jgi:hypothetical protein
VVPTDIDLPSPRPPSSTPPEAKSFVTKAKSAALVLTAAAGLVAAIAANVKPRDDSATKAGYEALSKDIKKLSRESGKLHDDMVQLRAYVDGYMRAKPDIALPVSSGLKPAPVIVVAAPSKKPPAPPDLGPRPPEADPAAFEDITPKK